MIKLLANSRDPGQMLESPDYNGLKGLNSLGSFLPYLKGRQLL